jgi:puromycin-sensitive aminopeptidase
MYSIELAPDLERFTFEGSETIILRAREPFQSLELHALDLQVKRAEISLRGGEAGERREARSIRYNAKKETVILDFGGTVDRESVEGLHLEFEGTLNDQMHGFYRTSYEVKGAKRWGAATQFEATDARRAFPCWDEPDRKAEFQVTLKVPERLAALSNMPVVRESVIPGVGLKRIVYEKTPRMSTYLLAFVVAELECVEARDADGVLIRVWTAPGRREQGRFALEVALHTLPYFADWFGLPYQLPKLDMVALPDFASGAMENWGLVTYRETALLVDPLQSSQAARQRVAEVIDHELAHQWFGNLVTMEWWTDLWLNEGFASYMGPKAVDHQFPEWRIWDQYCAGEGLAALRSDSLRNTHPIEIDVKNPHEIREIFDPITYNKGSVVNRMLEHFLGERVFQKGLRLYLKRHAYENAGTRDLWLALEEVSGKPVRAMMAGYTCEPGYPVVSVGEKAGAGSRVLELEQERFLLNGRSDRRKFAWHVPVGITGPGMAKPCFFLMKSRRLALSWPQPGDFWVKLNPGQSGFYRVGYDAGLVAKLRQGLTSPTLSVTDRLGVVDDAWALARAGWMKTSDALEMLERLRGETEYIVWTVLAGALGQAEILARDARSRESLECFGRFLFQPIARRMGWRPRPRETHLDVFLRSLVISGLGHCGDPSTVQESRRRFRAFLAKGELDPNVRHAVYATVAAHGGGGEFEKLTGIYRKSTLQEEKVRVLRALTRFRERDLIRKVLGFSLSADVRAQDSYVVLAGFGSNRAARSAVWDFIKSRWKKLVARYRGGSVSLLGRIVEGATGGFAAREELADVKRFLKAHPVPGTERTVAQSIEWIQSNAEWAERDGEDAARWLRERARR